jgi:prepilin peptidase CpaA
LVGQLLALHCYSNREKEEGVGMHSFAWWPTVIVLSVATFTDLRSRRIPNWLVLPFLPLGVIASGWLHGWHGVGQSLEGAGLGALIYGILYWKFGMGAGDVKLCAAIGAWIGPSQFLTASILTALAGGLGILIWMLGKWAMQYIKKNTGERVSLNGMLQAKMPYAPAIAIGTLFSFFAR